MTVSSPSADGEPFDLATVELGSATLGYLDQRATESFKRQIDLEESIWRSLPLFSGGLIAGGAVASSAGTHLQPFHPRAYDLLCYGAFAASVLSFAASFVWLWQIMRPRYFVFPPDDDAVARYATEVAKFHAGRGIDGDEADQVVLSELRAYMASAYRAAAASTLVNNQARLSARSQVLAFLLLGFLFVFLCDGLIYGAQLVSTAAVGASANGER